MRTASCTGDLADDLAGDLADGLANKYPDDYTWSAHPECNIPVPQGEGLGVGAVTSTPRGQHRHITGVRDVFA